MFNKQRTKIIFGIIFVLILIALDQFTKYLAVNSLKDKADFIIINGVFQLHYLENHGAAFSILQGQQTFFKILTPIFLLIVAYIYIKMPANKKFIPLNWIIIFTIAGAIGNYIDRLNMEYVVDFLYFSLIDFPVFNVADIYVTCSVILLIVLILFYYKEADIDEISKSMKFVKKD